MTVELSSAAATDDTPRRVGRGVPAPLLAALAALTWWGVGFLPWIVDLAGGNILTVNGFPRSALPLLSGGSVGDLMSSAGLGSVLAGLLVLLVRGRRLTAVLAVVAGVAVAVAVTLAQSRAVLGRGSGSAEGIDPRVVDGLTAVVVVMTLIGLALGLACLAGRPGAGVAVAAVAGLVPLWAYSTAAAISTDLVLRWQGIGTASRWLGAALLVVALVVIGVAPATRLVWWVVALSLAWIVAPTATAAGYLGSLVSRGPRSAAMLREYVSASWQVWRQAARPGERPIVTWIVAVVLAAVLATLLHVRRGSSAADVEGPPAGAIDEPGRDGADGPDGADATLTFGPRATAASSHDIEEPRGPGPAWP